MKLKLLGTSLVLSILLSGCASNQSSNSQPAPSGFLPDYSLLQPITSPAGTQIYTYKIPSFTRSNYQAVIIAPVILYQTATTNGVTNDQIQAARTNIANGIAAMVSKKAMVTNTPGPGVAQLSLAITGASLQGEGFKPRNLMPISAAVTLASNATNLNNKTPVMVVELKFTDSITGQLLSETVSTISGEQFRSGSSTAAEFTQLAQTWVHQALSYSLGYN